MRRPYSTYCEGTKMNWQLRLIAVSFFAIACTQAMAQSYPNRPIRFLVGYAPGGGTDVMARVIAAKLTESLKQQVIVDNRPGANANIAAKIAADSPGDGYTGLFMSVAHIMRKPVYSNLGYDIERDLTPITVVSNVSNVLTGNPALPARSVKEFMGFAKARPGRLTDATSGIGSAEHLAGELLQLT